MEIKRVYAVYFSPTDNTRLVTGKLAAYLAAYTQVACQNISVTLPDERAQIRQFQKGDLVVVGAPTYAGKLPNKILPFFQENLWGNGALAVSVVTFGNRSFDHALAQLCAVLEQNGFHTIAGAAFVGSHAFSELLAADRPGLDDLKELQTFAKKIMERLEAVQEIPSPVKVDGDADAPYYVPVGMDGKPVNFLKATPKTDLEFCMECGICAKGCPMGSISSADPADVPGICIKCHRCIKNCPREAKYFDDPEFLSHLKMLETTYAGKKENRFYL